MRDFNKDLELLYAALRAKTEDNSPPLPYISDPDGVKTEDNSPPLPTISAKDADAAAASSDPNTVSWDAASSDPNTVSWDAASSDPNTVSWEPSAKQQDSMDTGIFGANRPPLTEQEKKQRAIAMAPATKEFSPSVGKDKSQPAPVADAPKEYGYGEGLDDAALKDAQQSRNKKQMISGIFGGLDTIAGAMGGIKSNSAFYENQHKQASQGVDDITAGRKAKAESMTYQDKQRLADPASPDNAAFRHFIQTKLPALAKSPGFAELTLANPALTKIADMWMKSEDRKISMEANSLKAAGLLQEKRTNAAALLQEKRTAEDRRYRGQVENEMGSLEKNIRGGLEIANAIKSVENKIGFSLDDYDKKTNTAGGQSVDLPGVKIPFIGGVSFYGTDARQLDAAMIKVFSVELKDRSGAAVTNNEMERMKEEFAAGIFNTEQDKLQAMRDYKALLRQELTNRQARTRPDVQAEFQNRGGQLATDILGKGPTPSAPQQQAPTPSASQQQPPRPGAIVNIKGVKYRIGADGDFLEPIQ